ncbi:hypothetical protein LTR53_000516 [Teratosphaeriaceae sp. CCFEE 6253]|nr:hypothetical protein LTR53_000516 [Teratosphaeriaceae sp. CCFEE 6253]
MSAKYKKLKDEKWEFEGRVADLEATVEVLEGKYHELTAVTLTTALKGIERMEELEYRVMLK